MSIQYTFRRQVNIHLHSTLLGFHVGILTWRRGICRSDLGGKQHGGNLSHWGWGGGGGGGVGAEYMQCNFLREPDKPHQFEFLHASMGECWKNECHYDSKI